MDIINTLTEKSLAKYFDHTFLKAYATRADFEKLCKEARELGTAMVAINSAQVRVCKELLKGCDVHVVISKVIFENCYLEKEEIKKLAEIAKKVKPDYIKTSTGFGTGGATLEDVRLMKETVGDDVKVKAAGGVRDWETCKAMIEAGAERIGTSSSIAILEGFRNERGQQK